MILLFFADVSISLGILVNINCTNLNVCKMKTKAYFSILFSLDVYKKPKFSKKNPGFPDFFLETRIFHMSQNSSIYHILLLE